MVSTERARHKTWRHSCRPTEWEKWRRYVARSQETGWGGKFRCTGMLKSSPKALLIAPKRMKTEHELRDSEIPTFLINVIKKYPVMVKRDYRERRNPILADNVLLQRTYHSLRSLVGSTLIRRLIDFRSLIPRMCHRYSRPSRASWWPYYGVAIGCQMCQLFPSPAELFARRVPSLRLKIGLIHWQRQIELDSKWFRQYGHQWSGSCSIAYHPSPSCCGGGCQLQRSGCSKNAGSEAPRLCQCARRRCSCRQRFVFGYVSRFFAWTGEDSGANFSSTSSLWQFESCNASARTWHFDDHPSCSV